MKNLAAEDVPGDVKQDLSSMIAQGILGLMRPLLGGLKVSKTHFVYFCEVAEQNCILSKPVSRRGFSSTCKLQGAPEESRLQRHAKAFLAYKHTSPSRGSAELLHLFTHS
ncbi:hypothetical protein ASZ78_006469 [Callipepla squamata]|uniref:Uncharacterized protein n=1 Tax=Callipepla squamata TaxID=9009 RepID=A0A226N5R8_CALSU|nr:hypothetical protein ASZ78_006469 [Callipepla squamata]